MKFVQNPFFSIVIPCYNSKKTIARLLNSIVAQNMSDEIEVILSDDHSTESYDNEIQPFFDKLYIKRIITDYNCCPGNTREKGVSIATGEWLMFADHDDVFLHGTFREIKKQIIKNKEELIAYCNIYRSKNTDGKFTLDLIEKEMKNFNGLLHGKVFNKKNLWDKFDIHFKKDMFTHEDTYLITKIECILHHLKREPLHLDIFNYVWFNNSKSLSNANGVRKFLEENFNYFVDAKSNTYKDYYKQGLIDDDWTVYSLLKMILYEYFYMQMFIFVNPETYIKENVNIAKNDLVETKKMFNLTNVDIWWYCADKETLLYNEVARECGYGYIPNYSLMEWLKTLDPDK